VAVWEQHGAGIGIHAAQLASDALDGTDAQQRADDAGAVAHTGLRGQSERAQRDRLRQRATGQGGLCFLRAMFAVHP
jgi:hypothetical protein